MAKTTGKKGASKKAPAAKQPEENAEADFDPDMATDEDMVMSPDNRHCPVRDRAGGPCEPWSQFFIPAAFFGVPVGVIVACRHCARLYIDPLDPGKPFTDSVVRLEGGVDREGRFHAKTVAYDRQNLLYKNLLNKVRQEATALKKAAAEKAAEPTSYGGSILGHLKSRARGAVRDILKPKDEE